MPENTFQPAEVAAVDTYIDERDPAVNYGASAQLLWISRLADTTYGHLLLQFALSPTVPPGAVIDEMILSMLCYDRLNQVAGTQSMEIHRILAGNSDWTEAGATWNTKDGANPWAGAAGCSTAGTDFAVTALKVQDMTIVPYSDLDWHDFIFDVSEANLLNAANYGFICRFVGAHITGVRRRTYRSSGHGTALERPKLYVRWTEIGVRPVKYSIDVWDPEQRVLDPYGKTVPRYKIKPNNWIRVTGLVGISGKVYDNFYEDPALAYIESVQYDGETDQVQILTNRGELTEVILARLSSGNTG